MEEPFLDEQPAGKRWDPLGAPNDDENREIDMNKIDHECHDHSRCTYPMERLRNLEEEQEMLNTSLFALTTHFAQVQFRLRQVVEAEIDDKEELLKALEEFAFRGIPEVNLSRAIWKECNTSCNDSSFAEVINSKRCQQLQLIDKLKTQLRELESYAFETGEAGIPQDVLLERQKLILDELKTKLNLNMDDLECGKLTSEELRNQVDTALSQLVSPLKMKEHLVNQLKTQVADLERFIKFLQADIDKKRCTCKCPVHAYRSRTHGEKPQRSRENESESSNLIRQVATILQMFAVLQFGCGVHHFRKNGLKSTMKSNHWGDIRARLEMAVNKVLDIVSQPNSNIGDDATGDYNSDTESSPVAVSNTQLISAVRKDLAISMRDLIQHGLSLSAHSGSVVPFMGCFAKKMTAQTGRMHAWELILEYYHIKNGERYNSTPARKLSQSFNLDISGGSAVSSKQALLSTIESIISSHTKYKRSYDSQFKAFICAGLNAQKLVTWLKLIFQCRQLINSYYETWSYVHRNGFQDSLQSLDALTPFKFDLPVDLAIRQFQNIKDVFT